MAKEYKEELKAFAAGFLLGSEDVENGYSGLSVKHHFTEWLESQAGFKSDIQQEKEDREDDNYNLWLDNN